MRNFTQIMNECKQELDSIGMHKYSPFIMGISVNNRLSRSLGRCKRAYYATGEQYWIELAEKVAKDNVDLHFVKNIIMHELVHTMPGCFNHGPNFHRKAEVINRYLGYHIGTEESGANMLAAGVAPIDRRLNAKYKVVCEKCGQTLYRLRWCDLTANAGKYTCTRNNCGGHFKTYSLDPNVAIASAIWSK